MSRNLKQTFGDGPYPFPIESFREIFDVYESDSLLMLDPKPSVKFDLFPGSHHHTDYEFLIPYSPLEHVGVEEKEINLNSKHMLLIHSDQPHGPLDVMRQVRFFSLSIDKEFFNGVGESVLGQAEIYFRNSTFLISSELEFLLRIFMQEAWGKQMGNEMILKCLSQQIVIYMLRQIYKREEVILPPRGSELDVNIKKAIEMLHDQYNQDFTLEEMAKAANFSPYHFIRVFKLQTGKTPFAFLLEIKLARAKDMLKNEKLSITEICYSCGFKSTSHFATVFKRMFGVSPSEYRLRL